MSGRWWATLLTVGVVAVGVAAVGVAAWTGADGDGALYASLRSLARVLR